MTPKMNKLDRFSEKSIVVFLYIFAAFMPFKIAVTQSSIGLAIFFWLLRLFVTKGTRFKPLKLEWGFLLFVAASLISLPFSQNVGESFIFLKRLLLIPIVYVLSSQLDDEKIFKRLIYIFVFSVSFYSLLGIKSFLANPTVRVRNIHNSMTAGGITMIGSLAAMALAVLYKKKPWQWIFAVLTLINLMCLILTSTRGSWLGFFVGALLIVYFSNRKLIIAIIALMPVVYFLGPDAFSARVQHMFDPTWRTNAKRIAWWSVGWEIFKDHPIVGVGDMSTQKVYKKYAPPGTTELVGHFHSNYVHIAVTLGIVGLAAFLFMMVNIFVRLWKQKIFLGGQGPSLQYAWVMATLAVFLAFLLNGFFEWNYGDAEVVTMVWYAVGMAFVIPLNKNQVE